jgi:pilus assembly protein Flp/PilA
MFQTPFPRYEVLTLKSLKAMNLNSLFIKLHQFVHEQEGQDLVEYALVVALIAFGAVAGMNSLASGLNTAFNQISGTLATAV